MRSAQKNCGNSPAFFTSPSGIVTDRAQTREYVLEKAKSFIYLDIKDLGWSDAITPDSVTPYRLSTEIDLSNIYCKNGRSHFSLWIIVRYDTNRVKSAYSIFEYGVSFQGTPSMLLGGGQAKPQIALKSSHMI